MKHLCCTRIALFFVLVLSNLLATNIPKSALVYYGTKIPYTLIGIHDYIIVHPENINSYTHGFKLYNSKMYAYVSIGESTKEQSYYKQIQNEWIVGENRTWDSKVMDISNSAYRDFLIEKVISPLAEQGFKNFFFDTIDSYMIATQDKEKQSQMQEGLVEFIHKVHTRFPQSKLILNRGFEIIDDVHSEIEAVLIESLFNGLSPKDLSYQQVSQSDREWILQQTNKITQYKIPIIILDYLPSNSSQIDKNIKDIQNFGFIPYIGDAQLHQIGKSSKNGFKRELLMLYDDTQYNNDVMFTSLFLQFSMPVEYLGYIPVLTPISSWSGDPLDEARYAGAIIWINGKYATSKPKEFEKKIEILHSKGIKMLILESISQSTHPQTFKRLQIDSKNIDDTLLKKKKTIECIQGYTGFEIEPFVPYIDKFYTPRDATPLCSVIIDNKKSVISAITPWGGYAFEGTITTSIQEQDMWIVNPFKLLRDALRLEIFPIPDVTTENGKRLLFSHVDGDGIMNVAEWDSKRYAGEILRDQIFSQYDIPISVSIIEAETAPHGLYPKLSKKLEQIARDIYKLPNIEPATHTFTHPFFWRMIFSDSYPPQYRLAVKDYNFSIAREINGSLQYINNTVVPKGKKAKITFWSGDCMPQEPVLKYMYKNNFLQINGGDTIISNNSPWLSGVAPHGIARGEYYQVFTGQQNENVFTNDWLGPFWGFKRVIQTFKLTDSPRRLKPINIYYHLYSGSKIASLNALKTVYEWAINQDVIPIFTSEYIPKVMDFYAISLAKLSTERWVVSGTQSLKTLRIPESKFVDFNLSNGVVGMKKHLDSRYIHLNQEANQLLVWSDKELLQNYLIDANAKLASIKKDTNTTVFEFDGEVPLKFQYNLTKECTLGINQQDFNRSDSGTIVTVEFNKSKDANASIQCR